tara:strand:+ start:1502 stop:1684 length:183 start_codon:yes stop_codon:yes gene_type:complete
MSKFVKNEIEVQPITQSFNVKETDFLLKLLMKSSFQGAELEVAYEVIKKITEMHRIKLEN